MSNKTVPTEESVNDYIAALPDERQRAQSHTLLDMMKEVTGLQPVMWGRGLIGFGLYKYKYPSGRSGQWIRVGFAPRSKKLSIYIVPGFDGVQDVLKRLGRHSCGKGCLYISDLDNIDLDALKELIHYSFTAISMKTNYAIGEKADESVENEPEMKTKAITKTKKRRARSQRRSGVRKSPRLSKE